MPLVPNPMPFNRPSRVGTFDAANCFGTNADNQTFTAAGTFDFGAPDPTILDLGVGRFRGYWIIDTILRTNASGDGFTLALMGSVNKSTNVADYDILQIQNYGSGAGRPTPIDGVSAAIPGANGSGIKDVFPFVNFKDDICYRYLRARVIVSGSTPKLTCNSWLTYDPC